MWFPVLGEAVWLTYQGPQHQDVVAVFPSLTYYDPASSASQDEVKATLGVYQAWYDRGVAASLT